MFRPLRPLGSACLTVLAILAATDRASAQNGTLVVVNKAANTASVIDVASGSTLATLPTGRGPHEVVLSSDGRTAVVADYGDRTPNNTLTVIDVPTLQVTRTIDLGAYSRPHGLAFLPGDSLVAVTAERAQSVVLVRVSDGQVVEVLPTGQEGSHMLAVTGDGQTIYTGNIRDGTVSQLDVSSSTRTRLFTTPPQPEAIAVSPDGREVWVGSNSEGKVSVIDTETGAVDEALEGFRFPYRILFTPDLQHVLIPDFQLNKLWIVERATREVVEVQEFAAAGPQGITISPDGSTIYHSFSLENRVAVIDVTSRRIVKYLDTGDRPDGVAYTPLVVSSR